jgi:glutathione synthase/RimK-type ligase-like ATP-grasp enzyme/ribosomal protein S18 acetylase RimI-like enzyme
MNVNIRNSTIGDFSFLEKIEKTCFPVFQQCSRRTLRNSLVSTFQEVWVAEIKKAKKKIPVATMTLHIHSRTLRVFSIGVLPEYQGGGIGMKLITHACNHGMARGYEKVSLEARANDEKLIRWYESAGFKETEVLKDYYCEGEDAKRMVFVMSRPKTRALTSNLIVVDNPSKWKLELEDVQVVSSKSYLSDHEFQSMKNVRVFNLCNSYRYQSLGYYVSLLGSAREHRTIPSVTTIRDFKNLSVIRSIANDIDELIQTVLEKVTETKFALNIYFGQTVDPTFRTLGHKLYLLFEAPLLQINLIKNDHWLIQKVVPLNLSKISSFDHEKIQEFASAYFSRKRFQRPRLKHYKYDLAILINPNEPKPPSCPAALRNFKNAANEVGFYVDFITKDDYENICEYDALFIRETTNVNDHTYQFARRAYAEGLAVIDDPWSILRCSNKIYLNERMHQNRIETPNTIVLTKGMFKESSFEKIKYPVVLKQPDSAFSFGVLKANDAEEMSEAVKKLFKKSDLIIVQEFLPSEFDWRIGVLDQMPLFACKYYMAKDHWQIYNWNASKEEGEGESETIPVEDVPEAVLKVAVKAASLMGDGLYGVDLKVVEDKVYLIEVNDNPNIDVGIEDLVLKEEIYLRIMQSLYKRIEVSRNLARYVAVEPD